MEVLSSAAGRSCHLVGSCGPVRTLVCSTPSSRTLLTDPTLVAGAYLTLLRTAVRESLTMAADVVPGLAASLSGHEVNVVQILRGGLSFGVDSAVSDAFGALPVSNFVGTRRTSGQPVELDYERWNLVDGSVLAFGDIVATGSTVQAVFGAIDAELEAAGAAPTHLVVAAIASERGVEHLERLSLLLAGRFPALRSATVIALESIFRLPPSDLVAPFPQAPFDLLRGGPATAPEFELERLRRTESVFDKCAVYDGGVRAFTPLDHLDYRHQWWHRVAGTTSLVDLGTALAGLDLFARSFQEWEAWSSPPNAERVGVSAEQIYELGTAARRYASTTSVAEHLDRHGILASR